MTIFRVGPDMNNPSEDDASSYWNKCVIGDPGSIQSWNLIEQPEGFWDN